MWNLQDDNELDKLSREAAEDYSMDRSPDSWNKVHLRLEAEMPQERRRRYLLLFLLVLFLGSGAFWLSRMNTSDEIGPEMASQSNSLKNEDGSNKQDIKAVEADKPAPSAATSNTQRTITPGKDAIQENEPSVPQPGFTPSSVQPGINPSKKFSLAEGSGPSQTKNRTRNKTGVREKEEVTSQTGPINADKNSAVPMNDEVVNKESLPVVTEDVKKPDDQSTSSSKVVKDESPKQDQLSTSNKKAENLKKNSRWTFGAAYAPDISTVKFTHSQPVGLNLGFMVEYGLSKKFSLQTGLIYTKKNYKMKGEDYHPPKGYWTDYVKVEDVTGNCSMLDVPLNLRFNAVRKKSSNIFFGAGLSTYLMKEENYTFYYYYNGNPTTRERSFDTDEHYLFSILNISAGYERKLSHAFSLQVEPFFKQSLTGVGFGDISLNSTGIYFSLRYNPLKPAKQASTAQK